MTELLKSVTVGEVVVGIIGLSGLVWALKKLWDLASPRFLRCKADQQLLQSHETELCNIGERLDNVEGKLDQLSTDSREYRRTSLSDKLFKKYQEYLEVGQVTRDQLENFDICVDRYRKCVDEKELDIDIVLTKYVPEVMQLPVK